jgi:hypothetical protein
LWWSDTISGGARVNGRLSHEVSTRGMLLCRDGQVKFLKYGVDVKRATGTDVDSDEAAEQVPNYTFLAFRQLLACLYMAWHYAASKDVNSSSLY